jgi:hypothetical protein
MNRREFLGTAASSAAALALPASLLKASMPSGDMSPHRNTRLIDIEQGEIVYRAVSVYPHKFKFTPYGLDRPCEVDNIPRPRGTPEDWVRYGMQITRYQKVSTNRSAVRLHKNFQDERKYARFLTWYYHFWFNEPNQPETCCRWWLSGEPAIWAGEFDRWFPLPKKIGLGPYNKWEGDISLPTFSTSVAAMEYWIEFLKRQNMRPHYRNQAEGMLANLRHDGMLRGS